MNEERILVRFTEDDERGGTMQTSGIVAPHDAYIPRPSIEAVVLKLLQRLCEETDGPPDMKEWVQKQLNANRAGDIPEKPLTLDEDAEPGSVMFPKPEYIPRRGGHSPTPTPCAEETVPGKAIPVDDVRAAALRVVRAQSDLCYVAPEDKEHVRQHEDERDAAIADLQKRLAEKT